MRPRGVVAVTLALALWGCGATTDSSDVDAGAPESKWASKNVMRPVIPMQTATAEPPPPAAAPTASASGTPTATARPRPPVTPDPMPDASSGPVDGGAVQCSRFPIELITGRTYGPYVVAIVRVGASASAGRYTFHAVYGAPGRVELQRDGVAVTTLDYDLQTPVVSFTSYQAHTFDFSGILEVDVNQSVDGPSDLSRMDESIFDGCHYFDVARAGEIAVGNMYGNYRIVSITIDPSAPSGVYNFFAPVGYAGLVALREGTTEIMTIAYPWQTTVGAGATYTFDFPGYFSITVTREPGTSNLYGLPGAVFDGRQTLAVP